MITPLVSSILYFAYGSNMLADRFFINNNGTRMGYGRLDDYRLGFNYYSNYWDGGAATIIPNKDAFLMGAIWQMSEDEIYALDQ